MKPEIEWEENRKDVRLKYSIFYGLVFAIVFSIIMVVWDICERKFSAKGLAFNLVSSFIGMSLIHYFVLWGINERYYQKRKQRKS